MTQETHTCQNCKTPFIIEPEDFAFYDKIRVPPPTFCPECRLIRRFVFRNARTIYKRKVIGADKEMFSGLSPQSPLVVYEQRHWWSDQWDSMEYGQEYDFSQPFIVQLGNLMRKVPFAHGYNVNSTNSEYCNNVDGVKNCYLVFNTGFSENCYYGSDIIKSNDCVDVTRVDNCELSYGLLDCDTCYRCFFSRGCVDCSEVYFSRNLLNCRNCFGCVNLRHKKFCIFNEQHSEDEYRKRLHQFNVGSYQYTCAYLVKSESMLLALPQKYMHGQGNANVTGNYISHSKNTKNSFLSIGLENCAHCQFDLFLGSRDCYDMNVAAGELCYEVEEGGGYGVKFCWLALPKNLKSGQINLSALEYSINTFNSSHLFACIGLRNKQYCILNKQYTKEEYEALLPKIIEHMNAMPYIDSKGRVYKYGEFFPPELSPFAYNETIAQEYFPLTREQALEKGYRWKDPEERSITIQIPHDKLPDHIKDADDSIVNQVIGCQHKGTCNEQCTLGFKIIEPELAFYRKMHLPLPRLCPNCRHYQRLKQRNPLKLWQRRCMCKGASQETAESSETPGTYRNIAPHRHGATPCPEEFETSYAPERLEMVYCEGCYNAEVV